MASFNKVILVGNVTRDPEVKYINNGTAVTDLGLAVNRSWFDKQQNQRREETTFVDVTLWGRQAEVAGEYLSKGRSVLIEGRLQLDSWDDRETGKKRSKLRVIGENMTMLGGRGDGGKAPSRGPSNQGQQSSGPSGSPSDAVDSFYDSGPSSNVSDDDVPF
ncbi:single-stranded DNA-binding protein [Thalassoglobus polymorphus]|uniref:Single-stranded DNA-binding protein n=1 Tax=Thalassoglobus polymorphus TaxID=2527994 RepID=A0A517QRW8_9PLAN|nr:single-stranded DNA-binding protein [Thalassoglobus polymorphus]QDT34384.1 Single-stranded DNA-binding protein [Thalassoglobus polymorphus]